MFFGCSNLTTLDISNFNTKKVANMENMFRACINLTTLDLSSFNIAEETNISGMLMYMPKSTTVYTNSQNNNIIDELTNAECIIK